MSDTLSLVLFSGTDDKLQAAAILAAGAAALGKPVNVLLQFWALDAFRTDRAGHARGLSAEAGPADRQLVDQKVPAALQWLDTFRQVKELGEVNIQACSASMDLLKLEPSQLDPVVDGVSGVATFFLSADDGQLLFI